jgi:hypothetical protein
MGEILAAGVTHYPPLTGHDNQMTGILKRMLQNPQLPDKYRHVEGWPAPMREEWGGDEGTASACRHRAQLLKWFSQVRRAIDRFKPDFILMWGDDQYENFKEDVIPPYCIYAYETLEFTPPPHNVWGEPPDRTFRLPGHPAAARYLASALLEAGFDPAYAYRPLHHPLGHAFRNAILYLDYNRAGFGYPVVPFAINCYGRRVICQRGGLPNFDPRIEIRLDPPSPSPQRLFDLGAATARALKASPWRVVLMASSGWSHAFLTAKNYFLYPDTPADERLYEALRAGDYETWRRLPLSSIEDSGQHEILNWMCLAGAMKELGYRPQTSALFTTWIFNSSKCFMLAGQNE